MSEIYAWLGGGPGTAAILAAVIALVGVIFGALLSYMIAGRNQYVSTITVERTKWIEKLRNNIAKYSTAVSLFTLRLIENDAAKGDKSKTQRRVFESIDEIEHLKHVIKLQLNPWGTIDKNLLQILDGFRYSSNLTPGTVRKLNRLLIEHARWLLKAEWEKVKYEAHGPVYRYLKRGNEGNRLKEYETWTQEQGEYATVIANIEALVSQSTATPVQQDAPDAAENGTSQAES